MDPTCYYNMPLLHATYHGYLSIVNCLLADPRVIRTVSKERIFERAAARGHLAIVNRLLEYPDMDPSTNDNNAIRMAAVHGYLPVIQRLLLDPRVDPSDCNNFALAIAQFYRHDAVAACLQQDDRVNPLISKQRCMKRCADIKEEIMMAAWHPRRVERLLLAGYDIEDM
ncbi:MAG: hypothetical protein EB127_31105 [Alphaproteobacteria bacterium]|nr:hypothetical protein [Alphaproteobacteria bacterium]